MQKIKIRKKFLNCAFQKNNKQHNFPFICRISAYGTHANLIDLREVGLEKYKSVIK